METDYISRKAFIEQKERQYCQNCDRRKNSKGKVVYSIGEAPCRACGIGDMLDDVEDFPAADVQPVVRGKWVWNPNGMDWGLGAWCCDQCRIKAETWWANDRKNNPLRCSGGRFCGNCGADMRPAPEPTAEKPAPICQTCGNFETCPWQNDGNMTEYIRNTEGRVVACSDYKDKKG